MAMKGLTRPGTCGTYSVGQVITAALSKADLIFYFIVG